MSSTVAVSSTFVGLIATIAVLVVVGIILPLVLIFSVSMATGGGDGPFPPGPGPEPGTCTSVKIPIHFLLGNPAGFLNGDDFQVCLVKDGGTCLFSAKTSDVSGDGYVLHQLAVGSNILPPEFIFPSASYPKPNHFYISYSTDGDVLTTINTGTYTAPALAFRSYLVLRNDPGTINNSWVWFTLDPSMGEHAGNVKLIISAVSSDGTIAAAFGIFTGDTTTSGVIYVAAWAINKVTKTRTPLHHSPVTFPQSYDAESFMTCNIAVEKGPAGKVLVVISFVQTHTSAVSDAIAILYNGTQEPVSTSFNSIYGTGTLELGPLLLASHLFYSTFDQFVFLIPNLVSHGIFVCRINTNGVPQPQPTTLSLPYGANASNIKCSGISCLSNVFTGLSNGDGIYIFTRSAEEDPNAPIQFIGSNIHIDSRELSQLLNGVTCSVLPDGTRLAGSKKDTITGGIGVDIFAV